MKNSAPHLVQYQGSKRLLADKILNYMPGKINRLVEPFCGVAAISIASALRKKSALFHLNDINAPLVDMLREVIEKPDGIAREYEKIWNGQFAFEDGHIRHFYAMREKFNNGDRNPAIMLYLLARCVKGSVRYGKDGKFNQSPDKRRHGANPGNMSVGIFAISALLKGKTTFTSVDYQKMLATVRAGDLVYMDPPYQGVCAARDNRYFSGITFTEFASSLKTLNDRKIDYIISYDGECGNRQYGRELPPELMCRKFLLNAGPSAQETLLGRKNITFESLYISNSLYLKLI